REPPQGQPQVDRADHARGLARSPRADRLRDADHPDRDGAHLLPAGADGRVLPAAGARVRARGTGIAARRADRYSRAEPDPPVENIARTTHLTARTLARACLQS